MNARLFAIGDIHGCFDDFRYLVEEKILLNKQDKLVVLGDMIDKGEHTKEVIDYIINLQDKGYNIIPLKGNHEALLLDALQDSSKISKWVLNGGNHTLDSFGISSIHQLGEKYVAFFKNLKLYVAYDNYLFVHAGFNNEVDDPFDDTYTMLWKCKTEYDHSQLKDKVIIHGHCPISVDAFRSRIANRYSVVNIDTGCVYSDKDAYGVLSAVECKDTYVDFV